MKLDNFTILAVLTLDDEKTTLLAKEQQAGFHPYIGRQLQIFDPLNSQLPLPATQRTKRCWAVKAGSERCRWVSDE